MPRVYATTQDLTAELGYTPDNADQLLERASLLVDRLLIGARYATDDQGEPTDTDVADALERATVAQAAAWAEGHGSTFGGGGYDRATIGSVTLSNYAGSSSSQLEVDGVQVTPGTLSVLRVAGLLPVYPVLR